jgi:dihydroorotase
MAKMLIDAGFWGWVLGMPNTKPDALFTGEQARAYLEAVNAILAGYPESQRFTMIPTIQITEATTPAMIRDAVRRGVRRGKVYPRYVTTNSENGVVTYANIIPALREMQECGMICLIHAEHPSYDIEGLKKEEEFIEILKMIRAKCPRLKIVVEHITTRKMADWVLRQPVEFVGATITPQHLAFTIDDVIGYSKRSGGLMRVHNGCKPQFKFFDDLMALQDAATSGDPHFFYGGDDAPHLKSAKECGGSACGVFNTLVAIPFLIDLFDQRGVLDRLNNFLSVFGAQFHEVPQREGKVIFEERSWVVEKEYPVPDTGDSVVSLFAGETMRFQIVG